jgi:hypothetical protein
MNYAPSCPSLKAVESQLLKRFVIPRLMLVGWHEWWYMHTSLCSTGSMSNCGWTVCCMCPTVLTLYHQIITCLVLWWPLWQWQTECHAPICHTGEKASVTRHEHMLCFTHGRRLLKSVYSSLKNNCASNNIIVKVCEMVTCPTCIQHALQCMRHWFSTASCIFQNYLHVFNLYNVLFSCMLIPHSYLTSFLFLNNSTICIAHLHFQNREDRFCFVFLF